jgi:membrane protease YdiL (CAAX protease family)
MKRKYILDYQNLEFSNASFFEKIKDLFKTYFIGVGIILVILIIIISPLDYFITNVLHQESIKFLLRQRQIVFFSKLPFYVIILIGPLVEEILFRLMLVVNRKHISVFISVLIFELLGGKITTFIINNNTLFNARIFCYSLIGIGFGFISYKYLPLKVIDLLNKKRVYLIRFSIILFGLIHLLNISTFCWKLILFYPFFILPQIVMGYFITNLRLKYSFWWGFALHALFNGVSFFMYHI